MMWFGCSQSWNSPQNPERISSSPHLLILPPTTDLYHKVELWLCQLDTLPFLSERMATRSKQDQEAVDMLEAN